MRRQYTAEDREKFLGDLKATGLPVKELAERLGVSVSAAYSWVKRAQEPVATTPRFARVVTKSTIVVCVGAASIEVNPGFDPGLLRSVVEALGETT